MRYTTFVLDRPGGIHPITQLLDEEPAVTRVSLFHANILDDGTGLLLGRLRGDLDRVRVLLGEQPEILACDVSGEQEGLAYIHVQPTESIARFMSLPQTHEVFFELPLERAGSGVRVTMIGETSTMLQQAIEDIPDDLQCTLERTGEYPPDVRDLASLLTERQREILTVAVNGGYYDVPRQTTHREIADHFGLAVGTVSEHLRKIESSVFSAIVDRYSS